MYYTFSARVHSLTYQPCTAHAPYNSVIRGLCGCTVFFYIISWVARFSKKLFNIKCVFRYSLQLLSETFLILSRTERDVINVHTLHERHPSFLADFKQTRIFSTDSPRVLKILNSWKWLQWEPNCSVRTDRQTDRHRRTDRQTDRRR
jgi:hypothetical protein